MLINVVLPFPNRLRNKKREEHKHKILETFRKVQVSIPLLDDIKQVPKYTKFLKELYTSNHKHKGNEVASVAENMRTMP